MKKRIIISIILVAILIIGLLLPTFFQNNKKIVNALTVYNFEPLDGNKVYTKQISKTSYEDYTQNGDTYELLTFNFDSYLLSRTYMENLDGVDFTYNGNYLFNKDVIEYNARYVYEDTNIILIGKYDVIEDSFTCDTEVSYDAELDGQKETLCNELNKYNEDFSETVRYIFNEKELNYLKQKTKD